VFIRSIRVIRVRISSSLGKCPQKVGDRLLGFNSVRHYRSVKMSASRQASMPSGMLLYWLCSSFLNRYGGLLGCGIARVKNRITKEPGGLNKSII
jgi:hypothetical protein